MSDATTFLAARDQLLALRTDAARARTEFHWPRLQRFNWALDYFDPFATGNTQPALWTVAADGTDRKVSFDALRMRSNQVAHFLRDLGLAPGQRLLLMLGNEIPLWELMLAAMKLRLVVIPASTLLTPADLVDRIERGRVAAVVTSASLAERFATVPGAYRRIVVGPAVPGWESYEHADSAPVSFHAEGPTAASDPLLLYFTSGTTAKPKLVLHTHVSYPVGHLSTMYWIGLKPGDLHWNISSPGWAKHAWSCFFAPWNAGATVFAYNYARFAASDILGALGRFPITTLCAPPTVWRMLIQERLESFPHSLREVIGAGEPLNPEVIARVGEAWGLSLRDGYGQTETTAQIGNPPGQRLKPGSMGQPLPGYRVVLLDADGAPASEGEICLPLDPPPVGLMQGYEGDEAKSAEVTRDGFYHTGDVASRDEEGYITYVGRADDVFKASDYRISPFELESVLIEHEAVAEAAVVPSPDPVRLAVPKAFVVLAAGFAPDRATAASILAFTRERLAPYKRIRRIQFAELPKTISGKIRRVELRKREESRGHDARFEQEFFEDDL